MTATRAQLKRHVISIIIDISTSMVSIIISINMFINIMFHVC